MYRIYHISDYVHILKQQIKVHEKVIVYLKKKLVFFKPKALYKGERHQIDLLNQTIKLVSRYEPYDVLTIDKNTGHYEIERQSSILQSGKLAKDIVAIS